jgi:hypothetical protein
MSRTMSRVRSNSGGQPDNNSALPDISGNGKRIAFASSATNLITSPPTGNSIFFADQTITGEWRVSGRLPLDSGGNPVATKPSISTSSIHVSMLRLSRSRRAIALTMATKTQPCPRSRTMTAL